MPRPTFGPPRPAVGAFFWAVLQLPRAVVWTLRERALRELLFQPALVTAAVTVVFSLGALVGAGPLEALLLERQPGLGGTVVWLGVRVALTGCLLIAAIFTAWQLAGAITAASLERMALYVQREVLGEAPPPSIDGVAVVVRAARSLFPTTRRLFLWALTTLAATTLILVPVAGPVLVVVAQTAVNAAFLAHGAIADNRARLGLPSRLLLREPALLLGYALACVPVVLVPGVALVAAAPVTVGGALVALGAHRRRA
ncbi:MAG: EI24 domain-containing protein [Myxococcaceae bacterium]|nr:EI24 domain-containing protein [Myxococcaceae bacterium]